MHDIVMRLKSGREFRFKCEKYTIETYALNGELSEFTYEGGVGECPIYFQIGDVECIAAIGKEQIEGLEREPKRGKWILDEEVSKTHIEPIYICSACNYEAWGNTEKTPFCPNCGARMESKE